MDLYSNSLIHRMRIDVHEKVLKSNCKLEIEIEFFFQKLVMRALKILKPKNPCLVNY